jgi:hypothetical protein
METVRTSECLHILPLRADLHTEDLGSKEKGLGDQIEVKELSVKLKHAAVDESKSQTAEYRRQLAARQESHDKAEKANSRGSYHEIMSKRMMLIERQEL